MNQQSILAFSGKAGSGKSTASALVKTMLESTKRPIIQLSFASAVKEIAFMLFEWDGDKTSYYLSDGSLDLHRGRGLLINIGQTMRGINPDCWVNAVINKIEMGPSEGIFIIDDARFKNEVEHLRERGARLIRIENPLSLKGIDDATENDLDGITDWDHIIENNGTDMAAFQSQLRFAVKEV